MWPFCLQSRPLLLTLDWTICSLGFWLIGASILLKKFLGMLLGLCKFMICFLFVIEPETKDTLSICVPFRVVIFTVVELFLENNMHFVLPEFNSNLGSVKVCCTELKSECKLWTTWALNLLHWKLHCLPHHVGKKMQGSVLVMLRLLLSFLKLLTANY